MSNRKVIKSGNNIGLERAYDIVKSTVVTEKTTTISQYRHFVFEVIRDTNKLEISQAIEKIFKVKVDSVNVHNRKGKSKKFKGKSGFRNDKKLAFVKLLDGYTIDVGAKL